MAVGIDDSSEVKIEGSSAKRCYEQLKALHNNERMK